MLSDNAIQDAAQCLTAGADLEDLRRAAEDLRALSPDSALAQLVEEKIEQMMEEQACPSLSQRRLNLPLRNLLSAW